MSYSLEQSSRTMLEIGNHFLSQEGSDNYERAVEKIDEFSGQERALVKQQLDKSCQLTVVGEPLGQNVKIKKFTGSGGHSRFEG